MSQRIPPMVRCSFLIGAVVLLALGRPADQQAQAETAPATVAETAAGVGNDAPPHDSGSLVDALFSLGLSGFLIMLVLVGLSTAALALGIEHLLTIRPSVLTPANLAEEVRAELVAKGPAAAAQVCQARSSLLAFVLRAGLDEVDGGWQAVEKAAEDALAQQAAQLFRKIEYLSVIGNIAPMIGLLGTVTGMVFAFQEVADTQGAARAAQLAEGIYTALITTVGGLLVAIPSLAAFAVFRNRADQLVADAAYLAQHTLAPLKRARVRRPATKAAPEGTV